ncbi:MAG: cyclodeaminase/cyclohydrolase family protein [Phycisphaerae bacterium]|jgi:formiminotetrahydrofolate cyclodeaminase
MSQNPADYLSLPLERFLSDVASRRPSPGGGSVAAAAGALSAALACMVLEYTAGKKRHAEHAERLGALLEELKRARGLFAQLIREDVAAYERYAAARASPDPAEPARALATAVAVPMEIAAVAEAVGRRLDEVKSFVSPALYSDVQAAGILAHAAAESAGCTAGGNLAALPDRAEAGRLEQQLAAILSRSQAHRDAVLAFRPSS